MFNLFYLNNVFINKKKIYTYCNERFWSEKETYSEMIFFYLLVTQGVKLINEIEKNITLPTNCRIGFVDFSY